MARVKAPGVYMIRNILNGKYYIGSSKDLRTRWKKYQWAVNDPGSSSETQRKITQAMKTEGIDNFEFIVLEYGDKFEDLTTRLLIESRYIDHLDATNPAKGYNVSRGCEQYLYAAPRMQSCIEKLNRANPIIEYNVETGRMVYYLGGAKQWGDCHGYGKDVSSHTIKRGSIISGKYYLIYADAEMRKDQLAKIIEKKSNGISTARAALQKYIEAVEIVNKNW